MICVDVALCMLKWHLVGLGLSLAAAVAYLAVWWYASRS